MRNDSASPTPLTLGSASFQSWLEPNHLFQTCSPAGFPVPQPVSLTREGRNIPNLLFPQSSCARMKLNSRNLEFFTVNEASFISQLIPVYGCYSAASAGRTLQARSPVCHPSGSRPRPARALRAGGSCRGLARIWGLGGSHGSPHSGSGVN